jgi:C4-type Zn-finger protein
MSTAHTYKKLTCPNCHHPIRLHARFRLQNDPHMLHVFASCDCGFAFNNSYYRCAPWDPQIVSSMLRRICMAMSASADERFRAGGPEILKSNEVDDM